MRLDTLSKKLTYICILIILLAAAINGVVFITEHIGMVTYHGGRGGYIYELNLEQRFPVTRWAGVYGVAIAVGLTNPQQQILEGGEMEEENLLFDCFEDGIDHEVYASPVPQQQLDLTNVQPATPADVDAWIGVPSGFLTSGTRTFTSNMSINFGTRSLSIPATYTMKLNESPSATFATGVLKDGNGQLFIVTEEKDFQEGFNGRIYNYQLLIPLTDNGTEQSWYFWPDPNDVCPPSGNGSAEGQGAVAGNVTDTDGNPIEGVIIHVGGQVAASTASGFYNATNVRPGNQSIFAVKEDYEVYYNTVEVNENGTTIHDIVLQAIQPENPFTNQGPGQTNKQGEDDPGDAEEQDVAQSENEDVGPGQVDYTPILEQPKRIEGKDYIISLNELKRKLRRDEFRQEIVRIISYRDTSARVNYEVVGENLSGIVVLDKEQSVLDPNGEDYLTITIFGSKPIGIYNGSIVFSGDFNATIPVEIEILSKQQLPIEAMVLELTMPRSEFVGSADVQFQTHLRNLLVDRPYPVRLVYTVQTLDGKETLWTKEQNTFLNTQQSLLNTFELPTQVSAGDYILRVSAYYLELYSSTSTLFTVKVPFWQIVFLGLRIWMWALILLALGGLVGAYFYWRRVQESKKKFHLKVDYNELPKPGSRSIFVGKIAETEHKTYFNLEGFKVHTIVAGSTGGGKSVSAQVFIEEMLLKDVAILVFDPTAQWSGMLRKCADNMMLALYSMFGMKKEQAQGFNGNIRQITDPLEIIDIDKYMKPGEIQVFACHKLDPKDMDIFVANTIREFFRYGLQEHKELRAMLVFDEVHRLLPKFGGSGQGFLQIERACREFRKWGIGVMLVSQVLSDFVGTIKANINTEVQMRTRDEGDLERIRQKYGEEVLRSLVKATVGSGMVENPKYNNGKPYFIAFRPLLHSTERLSDEEIQMYEDFNTEVDNLTYSLDQLEQEKVDVFDLRLELKLALDKVKSGQFNMVKIYLDGLKPRIDKQWEKLGKKPKPFERRRASREEIEAEVNKAKDEHDKAQKEMGAAEQEGPKEIGWDSDVPPDKILNLTNGMLVVNLASLFDEVSAMKDEDYPKHVNEEKNDFAVWVRDVIGDEELAKHMSLAANKEEMLKALEVKKNKGKFEKLSQEQLKTLSSLPWYGGAKAEEKPAAGDQQAEKEKEDEKPEGEQAGQPEGAVSDGEQQEAPTGQQAPPEPQGGGGSVSPTPEQAAAAHDTKEAVAKQIADPEKVDGVASSDPEGDASEGEQKEAPPEPASEDKRE